MIIVRTPHLDVTEVSASRHKEKRRIFFVIKACFLLPIWKKKKKKYTASLWCSSENIPLLEKLLWVVWLVLTNFLLSSIVSQIIKKLEMILYIKYWKFLHCYLDLILLQICYCKPYCPYFLTKKEDNLMHIRNKNNYISFWASYNSFS